MPYFCVMRTLVLHFCEIIGIITMLVACGEKKTEQESVTQVTIYPSSFTMIEGESRKIEVIVSPRNASYSSIRWISSNNKVVSVTNGLVSALAPGRA